MSHNFQIKCKASKLSAAASASRHSARCDDAERVHARTDLRFGMQHGQSVDLFSKVDCQTD